MSVTVDLFSGPRGWDTGARAAGLPDALGIEHDADACATSRAAGFPTLQADVAAVPLTSMAHATGHIASPPCPTFSSAGAGSGRDDMPVLVDIARMVAAGGDIADGAGGITDPRTLLCAEPLRWALALRPNWLAWEQVPPVLPFWDVCAEILSAAGYAVWTGLLRAEQFGVPQTRTRAFLLARRDGENARPPRPTHRRYVLPRRAPAAAGLFPTDDLVEDRIHPDDHGLLPWVSIAQALGWRDGKLVSHQTVDGGPFAERAVDAPALTVPTCADLWLHAPTHYDRRQSGGDGTPVPLRSVDAPAPTLGASGLALGRDRWVGNGPPRRITVVEAARLQSFPADHPMKGTRAAQFRQIGNAVPPLLAQRVIEAVAGQEIHAAQERVAA